MTDKELEKRKERAESETFVISRTDEGFRVYNPAYPTKSYVVSGSPEEPQCTCPDFQTHEGDPQWRCKHILAVLNNLEKPKAKPDGQDRYDDEERRAIQGESRPPEKKERKPRNSNGGPQMILERSVSPDGRIDSLSVEFALPVGKASPEEIKARAGETLNLQSEIVKGFLSSDGKKPEQPEAKTAGADGTVPAQMLDISGMPGKWGGRRLFINVQVNGQVSRLFGSRDQLAAYIIDAGFQSLVSRIDEGFKLNLPCRVITKPSKDGRFTNIAEVLPIQPLQPKEGRVGR